MHITGTSGSIVSQLEPQLVEARLVDLDEHELGGAQLHDLAAQLRADRAGGAGDRDDLAGDGLADLLDVDAASALGRAGPRPRPCAGRRTLTEPLAMTSAGMMRVVTPASAAAFRIAADGLAGRAGHRDEHLLDVVALRRRACEVGGRAEDAARRRSCGPAARGSSSRKPTRVRPSSGRFWISRSSSEPALPAPTMSTRRPSLGCEART